MTATVIVRNRKSARRFGVVFMAEWSVMGLVDRSGCTDIRGRLAVETSRTVIPSGGLALLA